MKSLKLLRFSNKLAKLTSVIFVCNKHDFVKIITFVKIIQTFPVFVVATVVATVLRKWDVYTLMHGGGILPKTHITIHADPAGFLWFVNGSDLK